MSREKVIPAYNGQSTLRCWQQRLAPPGVVSPGPVCTRHLHQCTSVQWPVNTAMLAAAPPSSRGSQSWACMQETPTLVDRRKSVLALWISSIVVHLFLQVHQCRESREFTPQSHLNTVKSFKKNALKLRASSELMCSYGCSGMAVNTSVNCFKGLSVMMSHRNCQPIRCFSQYYFQSSSIFCEECMCIYFQLPHHMGRRTPTSCVFPLLNSASRLEFIMTGAYQRYRLGTLRYKHI